MPEVVIAAIPKGGREEFRIALLEWRGVHLASLRVWFRTDDGTMRPGKDGLNFRLDFLPEIADAMNMALTRARSSGLVK